MTDSRNSHRSTMVLPLWRKGKYFFAIKFSLQRKALRLSRFSQERKEEASSSEGGRRRRKGAGGKKETAVSSVSGGTEGKTDKAKDLMQCSLL